MRETYVTNLVTSHGLPSYIYKLYSITFSLINSKCHCYIRVLEVLKLKP